MGTDSERDGVHPRESNTRVQEEWGDLFTAPLSTSLAHCVSSDMKMGAGIAVRFREKFGQVDDLLLQGKKTGEVAYLKEGPRYIFYLVTKDRFFNKPTEDTLRSSLLEMKAMCGELGIKKLAMPRIGCGLDGLEWSSVFEMIREVFCNTGIHITIYNIESRTPSGRSKPDYEWRSAIRYSHPGTLKRIFSDDSPGDTYSPKRRRFDSSPDYIERQQYDASHHLSLSQSDSKLKRSRKSVNTPRPFFNRNKLMYSDPSKKAADDESVLSPAPKGSPFSRMSGDTDTDPAWDIHNRRVRNGEKYEFLDTPHSKRILAGIRLNSPRTEEAYRLNIKNKSFDKRSPKSEERCSGSPSQQMSGGRDFRIHEVRSSHETSSNPAFRRSSGESSSSPTCRYRGNSPDSPLTVTSRNKWKRRSPDTTPCPSSRMFSKRSPEQTRSPSLMKSCRRSSEAGRSPSLRKRPGRSSERNRSPSVRMSYREWSPDTAHSPSMRSSCRNRSPEATPSPSVKKSQSCKRSLEATRSPSPRRSCGKWSPDTTSSSSLRMRNKSSGATASSQDKLLHLQKLDKEHLLHHGGVFGGQMQPAISIDDFGTLLVSTKRKVDDLTQELKDRRRLGELNAESGISDSYASNKGEKRTQQDNEVHVKLLANDKEDGKDKHKKKKKRKDISSKLEKKKSKKKKGKKRKLESSESEEDEKKKKKKHRKSRNKTESVDERLKRKKNGYECIENEKEMKSKQKLHKKKEHKSHHKGSKSKGKSKKEGKKKGNEVRRKINKLRRKDSKKSKKHKKHKDMSPPPYEKDVAESRNGTKNVTLVKMIEEVFKLVSFDHRNEDEGWDGEKLTCSVRNKIDLGRHVKEIGEKFREEWVVSATSLAKSEDVNHIVSLKGSDAARECYKNVWEDESE